MIIITFCHWYDFQICSHRASRGLRRIYDPRDDIRRAGELLSEKDLKRMQTQSCNEGISLVQPWLTREDEGRSVEFHLPKPSHNHEKKLSWGKKKDNPNPEKKYRILSCHISLCKYVTQDCDLVWDLWFISKPLRVQDQCNYLNLFGMLQLHFCLAKCPFSHIEFYN